MGFFLQCELAVAGCVDCPAPSSGQAVATGMGEAAWV